MTSEASGTVAARWMMSGEWRAHPGRVVTAALAIAVGVALGFAVHLINASALNEFGRAVSAVNGEADLRVRAAGPQGFDETAFTRMARIPGVAAASAVVELPAVSGASAFTLIGLDVMRAVAVTPTLVAGQTPRGAMRPDSVYLSPALMAAGRLKVGQDMPLTANGRTHVFQVAGRLAAADDGQLVAVADIARVQWRFDRLGRIDRVDLRLSQGADRARVESAVAAALPTGAQLGDPSSDEKMSDNLSRAYRVNLDMLALMALLTGGFLVYSAQSLSVARRRSQFALLRVLGVTRRALLGQVLAEGAIVGGVGAILGLALGLGLAKLALSVFGGDLGGGFFSGASPELVFAPGAAMLFLALGFIAALAGSLAPAREAARAQPAVALKNIGDAVDPRVAPRIGFALAALVAGGLAALAPAVGDLPLFGYLSMALLLAGGVAAMPWLARAVLSPARRLTFKAPALDLAIKRLWGAPSQAAVALAGIVASTSLMIAMAVMVSSFRGSVDDWLGQILPADLYMRVEGAGLSLDAGAQAGLAATPGVARAQFLRTIPVRMAPDRPAVALIARSAADLGSTLPLVSGKGLDPGVRDLQVWVSEPYARIYNRRVGDRIDLPVGPQGVIRARIAGIWRDYSRQHGSIIIDSGDYQRLTGDTGRTEAAFDFAPGAPPETVLSRLRAGLPPAIAGRITFAQAKDLRLIALSIFDRSFAVTYLLEAVAILVGLAGVAATISAQTLARSKEFGMLRHVGVLRGQIIAMLAAEGALLGLVGGLAGVGLGLIMSQVLIHVINPQSFHWTMQTRLPWPLFSGVGVALIVASAGAALLAGRRALSADAVRAVREDW